MNTRGWDEMGRVHGPGTLLGSGSSWVRITRGSISGRVGPICLCDGAWCYGDALLLLSVLFLRATISGEGMRLAGLASFPHAEVIYHPDFAPYQSLRGGLGYYEVPHDMHRNGGRSSNNDVLRPALDA